MALFAVAGIFSYLIAVEGLAITCSAYYIILAVKVCLSLVYKYLVLVAGHDYGCNPDNAHIWPFAIDYCNRIGHKSNSFWHSHDCQSHDRLLTPPVGGFFISRLNYLTSHLRDQQSRIALSGRIDSCPISYYLCSLLCEYLPNLIFGIGSDVYEKNFG